MVRLKMVLGASVVVAAAIAMQSPTPAGAVVMGSAYFVPEAEAQNASIGFAHGAANATFSAPSPLSFTSIVGGNDSANYTLGSWLASSPGEITLTGTPADLAKPLDDGTNGAIFDFAGTVTVTNGQTFTVTHDDGLQLQIGGLLVIDVPGPTAPITTTVTYTGPSGNLPFELVYGECCGAPAVLNISLPLVTPAPEPGSLALLGSALAGLGAVLRRRKTG